MSRRLLGHVVHLDERVYPPGEDSMLLAGAVQPPDEGPALDVCTGTGLAALRLAERGARVVATDINPVACRLTRRNARANDLPIQPVCTDVVAGVHARFEAVACNPPYLPADTDRRLPGPIGRALEAGPAGTGIAARLVDALPGLLTSSGRAWLLGSSRQDVDALRARARESGLTWHTVEEVGVGRFERLSVVELALGGERDGRDR